MPDRCTHLRDLLMAQKVIIARHIAEYLLFQKIDDEEEGKDDFITKFGWIMRELYCGYICSARFDCVIALEFLPQSPDQNDPIARDILELAKQEIVRKHIDKHKWFKQIADREEAIRDFISRFGWIMQELICGYACEQRYECPAAKSFLTENKKLEPET
ncbi:MAG: hypothetical protein NTX82_06680 [Candidatus Parcubacteria bacterium]|nr:hypothetical protein [Candidatus Parcubacteria bacterium]